MNPLQSIQSLTPSLITPAIRVILIYEICAISVIRVICDLIRDLICDPIRVLRNLILNPVLIIRDLIRDPYQRNQRNPVLICDI
jgi:hypothetical protein